MHVHLHSLWDEGHILQNQSLHAKNVRISNNCVTSAHLERRGQTPHTPLILVSYLFYTEVDRGKKYIPAILCFIFHYWLFRPSQYPQKPRCPCCNHHPDPGGSHLYLIPKGMESQPPVLKHTTTLVTQFLLPPGSGKSQMMYPSYIPYPSCVMKWPQQWWECTGKEERCGEQDYLEPHWEVHQVEVQVVQLECRKALLESHLDQGLLVECVPQLWEETKPDCHCTAPTGQTRDRSISLGGLGGKLPLKYMLKMRM